ncbi:hypothetical protein ANCCAN_28058 [Ancylostoma caninum]|uniref:Uncharacterized protein n=1 Tax=Ancylostoma caninum TaxID=29170 RepID=A0A368F2E7_ANCCA|nr:hypothetical protein ANCCAN_28058 [Ancylostoma caninum]
MMTTMTSQSRPRLRHRPKERRERRSCNAPIPLRLATFILFHVAAFRASLLGIFLIYFVAKWPVFYSEASSSFFQLGSGCRHIVQSVWLAAPSVLPYRFNLMSLFSSKNFTTSTMLLYIM